MALRLFHRLFKTASIAWLALAVSAAAAGDAGWTQFRGPEGQGLSAARDVPVEWSGTKNVAWKVAIPGRGWSQPVLLNGRLYLTTGTAEGESSGLSLRALCVDAANGGVLWDTEVFRPDPSSAGPIHQKNSPASPTPVLSRERLYVHFGPMGTAALDLEGKVVWRQTELKYPPVHGAGGSPILTGETLIYNADGEKDPFVAALDAKTGAVRWKTPRDSPAQRQFSFSTPLAIEVAGATQVISPGSGLVAAYDPRNGDERWRVAYGQGYSVVPRPVFAHGLLFVSSGFNQPVLYAIEPSGAAGDAGGARVAWTHRKGVPHTSSMLALGDELYFISDAGIATCVDARTGNVHWTERLEGNFSASPIAAEGRIYFQSEAGVGY
ncbi:MAG: PQQ-like beta-propeller repeat protein, partial [Verrucomicrobiota bacterium]|nr:PQQ-like beta-propeller repeat protein [Verrucomicrobiota bacterium]